VVNKKASEVNYTTVGHSRTSAPT